MTIGELLRQLRQSNGLTQEELAKNLGIGQATVACYENGLREPHIVNLIAYADYFDCTVDFLIGRTDDRGNQSFSTNSKRVFLKDTELELIQKYRSLNKSGQLKLNGYLDGLLS